MSTALMSALGTRSALLGQRSRVASRSAQVVRAIQTPSESTLKASGETKRQYVKNMAGVSSPFPNVFDPLSLEDQSATVQDVRRWRESEVTHGRVAMLAVLGFLAQEYVEDTGFGPFPHVVGPAIGHFQQVEAKGGIFWEPLVLAIGLAETYRAQVGWAFPVGKGFNQLRDDHEPGNIGFDPLGLLPEEPEARKEIMTKELNNGRLAMIAIAGFVAQEFVDGMEIVEHLTGGRGGPGVPGSTYTELLNKVPTNS